MIIDNESINRLMAMTEHLGPYLRKKREIKRISLDALSKETGIPIQKITRYENQEDQLPDETVELLFQVLDKAIDE